ncbi:hypothetical protein ABH305_05065 [Acinetobacter pittii]|uniref:hypothetical protein n=1 Tax=Acinetobacter pittii TaxID=48296 RepID=UPI003260D949
MKPEQFIREFGEKKARHVLSGLPNYYTHMTDDARMFISEHNKELDEKIRKQLPSLIRLEELKRLVESIDLIKHMGGISEVKRKFRDNGSCHGERMKALIKDHESIYGGGDA